MQVALAREPGSKWPAAVVVEGEAMKSRKSLAFLSVLWYDAGGGHCPVGVENQLVVHGEVSKSDIAREHK